MIWFILIWALCNIGFVGLASTMSKHQKQIYTSELTIHQTHLATLIGWGFLILALIACIIQGDSISNMLSYWIGTLSFSALAVGLMLSYFETKIKTFTVISATLVILSTILYLR